MVIILESSLHEVGMPVMMPFFFVSGLLTSGQGILAHFVLV